MAHEVPSSERPNGTETRKTRVLPVRGLKIPNGDNLVLAHWFSDQNDGRPEIQYIIEAAEALRSTDVPVAFPTETVYGLGADATRSSAVQGIYNAKQRPSDNPLIVHIHSLDQLRKLLRPQPKNNSPNGTLTNGSLSFDNESDPVPSIYKPLISRFWPGPLTIILLNPPHSPLAPEVTSGLTTLGVRMPSSPLARLLILLASTPLAAPSANASTKPSPTTAQHVYDDLQGRIDIILDGGPCGVGVESTVVDGLSDPPQILRPGGVGIEEIRTCEGWENVKTGYNDTAQKGKEAPRAPGMKYRHYAPRAKVVLFEANTKADDVMNRLLPELWQQNSIGVVRTKSWMKGLQTLATENGHLVYDGMNTDHIKGSNMQNGRFDHNDASLEATLLKVRIGDHSDTIDMWDIDLGGNTDNIARGLFSALRTLDEKCVRTIFVEGISDTEGDLAAAIMNRLRKAAEIAVKSA